MKPYKIFSQHITDKKKGMVNDSFVRFISPADSVFSIFTRSFAFRHHSPRENENDYDFVIYDKQPSHIEMFKYMLTWNGGSSIKLDNFQTLNDYIITGLKKYNLEGEQNTAEFNKMLGDLQQHGFRGHADFKKSWDKFRTSKFTYINVDIIEKNFKFLDIFSKLPLIRNPNQRQFIRLDLNKKYYNKEKYVDSINNLLHTTWMRSMGYGTQTVVELVDDNNVAYEDFSGKLYVKLNPTFCILPWMHIQYKPSGQSKLCCRYDNIKEMNEFYDFEKTTTPVNNLSPLYREKEQLVIQKTSVEDSFYSNYWNTARQYTVENKPISGCHKCYKEEQGQGEVATSMRLGSSILYNDGYLHKKPKFTEPVVEFLEVGFGNYCNLACLSCNSTLSTTWHDDEVRLNQVVDKSMTRLIFPKLDNLKFDLTAESLKTLKLIKFTGGEPMINPEFIKFIDNICDNGFPEQVSLEIYTNCSYIPSPKLLTNLTKFKHVQLNLSIDAYGGANDYVRYGSNWSGSGKQTVLSALEFWIQQGLANENINVIMSSTLSILSVFDVPKLLTWWVDKFKDAGNKIYADKRSRAAEYDGFYKLQLAFDPAYISMEILPAEYYADIVTWCEEYEQMFTTRYPDLQGVPDSVSASLYKLKNTIKRCKGNPDNAKQFLHYLEKMDSIRGNSATESIPVAVSKVKEYLQALDKSQQN